MNYEFEYHIANENNGKMIDEVSDATCDDYEFNPKNLSKVISLLKPTTKMNQTKIDYIKDSMPQLSTIKSILDDVIKYYKTTFEPKSIEQSDDTLQTNIRFFMNKMSGAGEPGDATTRAIGANASTCMGEIRIYVKGFPDICKNIVNHGSSFAEVLDHLDSFYGRKAWFENYLRYILAHEMFHVLHECHYRRQNGNPFPIATDKRSDVKERILKEIFAEYFATAYIKHHLHETDSQNEIVGFNHIANLGNTKWFGCGRKKLIADLFSETEIAEDSKMWSESINKTSCLGLADKNDPDRPVTADYAGGYVLAGAADRYYGGKQGLEMPDYVSAYDKMLEDKSDEALYELIRLREKYIEDIIR